MQMSSTPVALHNGISNHEKALAATQEIMNEA